MNFEKSKVLLKKINALHEAADERLGVSSLEKDLMLQYVRDFYEAIKDKNHVAAIPKERVAQPIREVVQQEAPRIFEPAPEPASNYNTVISDAIETTKPAPAPQVTPTVQVKTSKITEELSALFDESEKEESGSRYLGGRITDIGKSMGINDKILTINDLFKGDQSLFNSTVSHLNSLSDFEEAKSYLGSGVAEEMNWADASRRGKAVRFINLMRRRYIS